jgi:hypothetical protein
MDASAVIESYVHDVARRLPRKIRNDVAFELRALLDDELLSRAASTGRPADGELALDLVREFGRPARTALRYHQPFAILEPSDTWGFLVAAVAGAVLISVLVAPSAGESRVAANDAAQSAFLGWLGALVLCFGAKNLVLRYRPEAFAWKPRAVRSGDTAGLVGGLGVVLVWLAVLVLYLAPGQVVHALTGGRVPAGELAYSDSFTGVLRMPWLVGLLLAAIGVELLAVIQGRWRPGTRWARIALLFAIGSQLGWHVRYGSIFQSPQAEESYTPVFAVLSGLSVIAGAIALYAEYTRVRPAPAGGPTSPGSTSPGTGAPGVAAPGPSC